MISSHNSMGKYYNFRTSKDGNSFKVTWKPILIMWYIVYLITLNSTKYVKFRQIHWQGFLSPVSFSSLKRYDGKPQIVFGGSVRVPDGKVIGVITMFSKVFHRCYKAEILLIRRKTPSNQSINQSKVFQNKIYWYTTNAWYVELLQGYTWML